MKMFVVSEAWFRTEMMGDGGVQTECVVCSSFNITLSGKDDAIRIAGEKFRAGAQLDAFRFGHRNVHEVKLRWLLPRLVLGIFGLPMPQ